MVARAALAAPGKAQEAPRSMARQPAMGTAAKPLLSTEEEGRTSLIGPLSPSSEHRACYAFAVWLLAHPREASYGGPTRLPSAYQVCFRPRQPRHTRSGHGEGRCWAGLVTARARGGPATPTSLPRPRSPADVHPTRIPCPPPAVGVPRGGGGAALQRGRRRTRTGGWRRSGACPVGEPAAARA